jgi:beta-ribofuranosylaminobenzene 5'-phosphate synthase
LGSGTQLAVAIGVGLARLRRIEADPWEIALVMGRCRRSGIGVEALLSGGFIVDAGHRTDRAGSERRPTIVWRRAFPAQWRFVIAVPDAVHGLSGGSEEAVFERLAPAVRISEEVCRLTQIGVMPALVEEEIEEFGRALTAVDRKTGEYFSDLQGGIYGNGATSRTIDALLGAGAHGAGQSSWGPAVYGLTRASEAERVAADVRQSLRAAGDAADVFICRGRNTGALVDVAGRPL